MHATDRADCRRTRDQRILQPLMIPLSVVVLDELAYRAIEVALTDRNHPVEALFFDRSDEPLRVGIVLCCGRISYPQKDDSRY
jgi:hypothetical protein